MLALLVLDLFSGKFQLHHFSGYNERKEKEFEAKGNFDEPLSNLPAKGRQQNDGMRLGFPRAAGNLSQSSHLRNETM